jgi:hypothetical protein
MAHMAAIEVALVGALFSFSVFVGVVEVVDGAAISGVVEREGSAAVVIQGR